MDRKVFVTQVPNRRVSGVMVPAFDVMPAAEHGEINIMLPASHSIFATGEIVKHLRGALVLYDYLRGDSIVPSGDPAIIMIVGAIVAEQNKKIRILKWERELSRYVPMEIAL